MEVGLGLRSHWVLAFVGLTWITLIRGDEIASPIHSDFLSPNDPEFYPGEHDGIPYRNVRRLGSEFLGKRSPIMDSSGEYILNPSLLHPYTEWYPYPSNVMSSKFGFGKRARVGSEFLGKRRLGSEFLGKRGEATPLLEEDNDDEDDIRIMEKRRLGSEFLGKRRVSPFADWSWKRARLGSEFLGKKKRARTLGSEFLGKRTLVI